MKIGFSFSERPEVCSLPKDSGRQCVPPPGPATPPPPTGLPHGMPPIPKIYLRTYYNSQTGRCEGFGYQGCGGNKNRFSTLDECKRTCMGDGPEPSKYKYLLEFSE